MIEGLAEQEISDEFTLIKNGVEYTFWSDDIIPVHKSEGFLKAQSYLKDWLEMIIQISMKWLKHY